jgi:hypothetical protein
MESPNSLGMIKLNHVLEFASCDRGAFCFELRMKNGRVYYLDAASDASRTEWMRRIQLCKKSDSDQVPSGMTRTSSRPISVKVQNLDISDEMLVNFDLCGTLSKLGVTGGWRKRYFDYSAHDNVLSYRTKKGKTKELGNIHLRKIMSVKRGNVDRCFELESPMRVYYLRANNAFERELWVRALESEIENLKSQNLDHVQFIVSKFY